MASSRWTESDLRQLRERGIPVEEAIRQLGLFEQPPGFSCLDRPATLGDGIETVAAQDVPRWIALHERAEREGRLVKFVPASGVATRMFKDLLAFHGSGEDISRTQVEERAEAGVAEARGFLEFLRRVHGFAFTEALACVLAARGEDLARLAQQGPVRPMLEALLASEGLAYADLPKGLVLFHRYPDESRTAFEEHLVEAAATVRDASGTCRLHFTVSPEHVDRFQAHLAAVRSRHETRCATRFEVGFSVQKPSTDTLAADPEGRPFRDEHGRLLFRPAGHGALIENLNDLDGDVVLVKNIDNIQPDRSRAATARWKKILGGLLLDLQGRGFDLVRRLGSGRADPETLVEARAFVSSRLGREVPAAVAAGGVDAQRAFLLSCLERPIRVCGVVRNTGEPGGGPFWVRGKDGNTTRQIVESAQIDVRSPGQQGISAASTHFNPVDLACGLRDARGRRFDLHAFVDPNAVIITRKSSGGRELQALERPGLWNGAMAHWNTVFVEVPGETFTPVKTVLDLLRPEHQK